jgi:hypothetical protein
MGDDDNDNMQELFMDDYDAIFDEDVPAEELLYHGELAAFLGSSASEDNPSGNDRNNFGGSGLSEELLSSITPVVTNLDRLRRSSTSEEQGEQNEWSLPPPTWQSEEADKGHRQTMILDIARLLRARKKTQPSPEWLQQLPHKARKLEERLYRTAPSLESYLSKRTLKKRLGKLARTISKQYQQARGSRRASAKRNSVTSQSSNFSFASQHSLASARNSMTSHSGLGESGTSQLVANYQATENSSSTNNAFKGDHEVAGNPGIDPNVVSSSSQPPENNFAPTPRQTSGGNHGDSGVNTRHLDGASGNSHDSRSGSSTVSTSGMSGLERQKAVNAKLQEQIMQNIRQQEELVRRLQSSRAAYGSGSAHSATGQGAFSNGALANQIQMSNMTASTPSNTHLLSGISNQVPGMMANSMTAAMQRSQLEHMQRQAAYIKQQANAAGAAGSSGMSHMNNLNSIHPSQLALLNHGLGGNAGHMHQSHNGANTMGMQQFANVAATQQAAFPTHAILASAFGNGGIMNSAQTALMGAVAANANGGAFANPAALAAMQAHAMQQNTNSSNSGGNGSFSLPLTPPSYSDAASTLNDAPANEKKRKAPEASQLSPESFNW